MKSLIEIKNEVILQSGDDVGNTVVCYDCGEMFKDSITEKAIIEGCIVCGCGRRIAYIIDKDQTK